MTYDRDHLLRWAASLHRSARATEVEAEAHGPHWEYYRMSLNSAQAQRRRADEYQALAATESRHPD